MAPFRLRTEGNSARLVCEGTLAVDEPRSPVVDHAELRLVPTSRSTDDDSANHCVIPLLKRLTGWLEHSGWRSDEVCHRAGRLRSGDLNYWIVGNVESLRPIASSSELNSYS